MKVKLLTLLLYLFFPVILLLPSGCSTPMMKASPFYTGEIVYGVSSSGKMVKWNDPEAAGVKKATLNQDAKHFDDDRVNVWPIFYKNFLIYSIIWPIGEINDVGWEIRSLVSIDNYNESYHAMAYLWGYNAKAGSSYLFPAYVRGNDYLYTPLFGWDKDLCYIVPPFYVNVQYKAPGKPDEKENIYFVFWPFAGFNTTKDESFVFPVYLDIDKGFYSLLYGYGEKFLYCVPPCFVMTKHPEGNTYNIIWPLCSITPSKNNYYSFPLFHYSDDRANEDFEFNYLFPFVARGKRIIGGSKEAGSGKIEYQRYLPFYYDYSDSEYTHTNYVFFGKPEKNINESVKNASYLVPFYYSQWDKARRYELDTAQPEKAGNADRNPQAQNKQYKKITTARKSTFIMPDILFSENEETGKYDISLVPFYFYNKDKSWISESTFLWLYTRHENIEKKAVESQALWYLYCYSHQDKTETEQERTSARILWKLYHREQLADESNFDIFPFISYSENQARSRFSFCWRLFNYEKNAESFKLHLFFIPVLW